MSVVCWRVGVKLKRELEFGFEGMFPFVAAMDGIPLGYFLLSEAGRWMLGTVPPSHLLWLMVRNRTSAACF